MSTILSYLLLPLRVLYKIQYLLSFSLLLLILYPWFRHYLSDPTFYPRAFRSMQLYARLHNLFTFVYVKAEGIENIPDKGSYIICPNHSSFADIPCIYSIFRNYFVFTGKKEIEKWPLFHIFYTSGMNILVDRKSRSHAFRAFKRMSTEIDKGNPLLIFPEGTISGQAPELTDFKSGAFAIAIQKQIPVLPVTFVTNWKRLQRKGFFSGKASPGIAKVIIHKPVSTTGLTKKDLDMLQENIRRVIEKPLAAGGFIS